MYGIFVVECVTQLRIASDMTKITNIRMMKMVIFYKYFCTKSENLDNHIFDTLLIRCIVIIDSNGTSIILEY